MAVDGTMELQNVCAAFEFRFPSTCFILEGFCLFWS